MNCPYSEIGLAEKERKVYKQSFPRVRSPDKMQ